MTDAAVHSSIVSATVVVVGRRRSPQPVVYVHCEGGLGRSPTIAIALLMQRGFTRAEAHRFMLAARSVASPTPEQDAWLSVLEEEVLGSPEAGNERPDNLERRVDDQPVTGSPEG